MALWRSTFIVSAMTMLSRVLGLVRDVVLLNVFGAGKDFDTFVVAFRIPNFFRRLFAEGAFSQAFIPVLTEYKTSRTHADGHDAINLYRDGSSTGYSIYLCTRVSR